MILAVAFIALAFVIVLCVSVIKRLRRVVEAEDADRVLRSEYDAFESRK